MAPTRLTVLPDETAAEMLCAALRAEGIRCSHVTTDISAGAFAWTLTSGGWCEVLVDETDLERARELYDDAETSVEEVLISAEELDGMSDEELVRLITQRSNLDERAAYEALAVLRGGPPPGVRFDLISTDELGELSDDKLVQLVMERGSIRDEARAREALDILRGGPPVDVTYEPVARHREPEEWEIVGVSEDDRYLIVTSGDTAEDARGRVFDARTGDLYPEARLMTHLAQFHGDVEEPQLTNAERTAILERARAANSES